MAWSPSVQQPQSRLVEQAGGYAELKFHHIRDGTSLIALSDYRELPVSLPIMMVDPFRNQAACLLVRRFRMMNPI